LGMSAFGAITAFGVVVAGFMWVIQRWHQSNLVHHKEQVEALLQIARSDRSH
jgi:LPLT family lysophospholipid transporter-like MFS transporter